MTDRERNYKETMRGGEEKRQRDCKDEPETREARVDSVGGRRRVGRDERATAAALLFSGTRGCLRWLKIHARPDSPSKIASRYSLGEKKCVDRGFFCPSWIFHALYLFSFAHFFPSSFSTITGSSAKLVLLSLGSRCGGR